MSELIPGDSTDRGATPFNSASGWRGGMHGESVDPGFEDLVQKEMYLLQDPYYREQVAQQYPDYRAYSSPGQTMQPMPPMPRDYPPSYSPDVRVQTGGYSSRYDDSQYFRVLEEDSPRVRRAKERLRRKQEHGQVRRGYSQGYMQEASGYDRQGFYTPSVPSMNSRGLAPSFPPASPMPYVPPTGTLPSVSAGTSLPAVPLPGSPGLPAVTGVMQGISGEIDASVGIDPSET